MRDTWRQHYMCLLLEFKQQLQAHLRPEGAQGGKIWFCVYHLLYSLTCVGVIMPVFIHATIMISILLTNMACSYYISLNITVISTCSTCIEIVLLFLCAEMIACIKINMHHELFVMCKDTTCDIGDGLLQNQIKYTHKLYHPYLYHIGCMQLKMCKLCWCLLGWALLLDIQT